ncbi:MAG: hypothetical protein H8E85_02485, partial [Candidatus Marinimicrobia bacterium]|nr:hypothetical protein [Candidatus Neomarinimicrobiota bacterium]
MNFLPFFILLGSLLFSASADHILLTRIVTQPDAAESFSIYNPTDSPINLSNYYICDDEDYFTLQTENDPAPAHIATGFTAQFPDIDINSGDTLTIILNSSYGDFYGSDFIPDLLLYGTETNSMLETEIGSFGGASDKINDSAEMIMLFYWDGSSETPIKDVDYFIWGNSQNAIDKSNVSGYQNDTPIESQLFLGTEAETYYAYSRIGTEEIDETQTGGNGINGHNETSENFRESWEIIGLFNIGCTDPNASNYNSEAEIDDGSCLVILSFSDIINNCSYYTSDIINCDGKYDLSSESAQECPLYEQLVTTKGFIIDYFDITPFGG